ncbi:hypothetical protein DES52_107137 [Deinococcus yavapaiensis KR-236]|uniref:Uncharacterized protein n=2 Tax=Deinococcus TaxID=1298 RepID=A0A318SB75_9DEIO|nr:hypothetical protein DES52_107137 [Deinococcus yavapaiensis KR-236]
MNEKAGLHLRPSMWKRLVEFGVSAAALICVLAVFEAVAVIALRFVPANSVHEGVMVWVLSPLQGAVGAYLACRLGSARMKVPARRFALNMLFSAAVLVGVVTTVVLTSSSPLRPDLGALAAKVVGVALGLQFAARESLRWSHRRSTSRRSSP